MKIISTTLVALVAGVGAAQAASILNSDPQPSTVVVTEGGNQSELLIGAGETVQFCQDGCFITLPNGDREALTGAETIEISQGRARFR